MAKAVDVERKNKMLSKRGFHPAAGLMATTIGMVFVMTNTFLPLPTFAAGVLATQHYSAPATTGSSTSAAASSSSSSSSTQFIPRPPPNIGGSALQDQPGQEDHLYFSRRALQILDDKTGQLLAEVVSSSRPAVNITSEATPVAAAGQDDWENWTVEMLHTYVNKALAARYEQRAELEQTEQQRVKTRTAGAGPTFLYRGTTEQDTNNQRGLLSCVKILYPVEQELFLQANPRRARGPRASTAPVEHPCNKRRRTSTTAGVERSAGPHGAADEPELPLVGQPVAVPLLESRLEAGTATEVDGKQTQTTKYCQFFRDEHAAILSGLGAFLPATLPKKSRKPLGQLFLPVLRKLQAAE
ncbi:unnamed protein product, partial [Amoebophrya sp. A120]|eukprot:GSA120T00006910001.1